MDLGFVDGGQPSEKWEWKVASRDVADTGKGRVEDDGVDMYALYNKGKGKGPEGEVLRRVLPLRATRTFGQILPDQPQRQGEEW